MKKISIIIPCYNEQNNVEPMADAIINQMEKLPKYDYEIIFRDNCSTDHTYDILKKISSINSKIKIIVNARNYGTNSQKDTLWNRAEGDIILHIPCDFQEPPELIPEFIRWYEAGYEVVMGQKISSKEGIFKYGLRQIFYSIIQHFSDVQQIPNASGIILFSRRMYNLRMEGNPIETIRFFVADLGCPVKLIQYKQQKRRSGKSSFNVRRSLSFAITSLITTSTAPLRIATILGVTFSFFSFLMGIIYLIMKLIWWNRFPAGIAPMLIGLFFIGSIQLLFIGLVGEYVGNVLGKVTPPNPPLVKELINFETSENDPYLFREPETDNQPVRIDKIEHNQS